VKNIFLQEDFLEVYMEIPLSFSMAQELTRYVFMPENSENYKKEADRPNKFKIQREILKVRKNLIQVERHREK
jgi:hypothetical protein